MALITFEDKNRLSPVDSPTGQIRADDINQLKAGVLTLENFLAGSGATVIVDAKGDFPAPVAGVITLVANTVYRIVGSVSIGTDRIDTNGGFIIGSVSAPNIYTSILTYTGTGTMITCTANDFIASGVNFICTTGTFLDFSTGGGTKLLALHHMLANADTLGTIDNPYVTLIRTSQFISATDGWTVSGANIDAFIVGYAGMDGVSGTAFDFGTSVIVQARIANCDGTLGNGEFFISGLADGANFSTILLVNNCSFKTSGTGEVFETITVNDTEVYTHANAGLQDTKHHAGIYVAAGAETPTTIGGGSGDLGNPIPILGTFTEDHAERFTTTAAGRIIYHNGQASEHFTITAILNGAPSSGTNITYNLWIAVNGVVSLMSRDQKTCSSGSPQKMVAVAEVDLGDTGYVEIWVENLTNTTNFVCNSVKLLVG